MFRKLVLPFAISLVFVLFVIFIAGGGQMPLALVDIPSLIIALVAPVVVTVVTFGWTKTREAFSVPFALDADRESLAAARAFFASLGRYLIGFTVFAVITGTILMLANVSGDNTVMIGRNLAVALLSIFYGILGAIFFVFPWLTAIDERLALE